MTPIAPQSRREFIRCTPAIAAIAAIPEPPIKSVAPKTKWPMTDTIHRIPRCTDREWQNLWGPTVNGGYSVNSRELCGFAAGTLRWASACGRLIGSDYIVTCTWDVNFEGWHDLDYPVYAVDFHKMFSMPVS